VSFGDGEGLCRLGLHLFHANQKGPRSLESTLALRHAILRTFETVDKPVTVRQMFYLLSTGRHVDKTEAGYRQAQRQLLAMRRENPEQIDAWDLPTRPTKCKRTAFGRSEAGW
jgi:hypothetical protein